MFCVCFTLAILDGKKYNKEEKINGNTGCGNYGFCFRGMRIQCRGTGRRDNDDDGVNIYEVEFVNGETKYEYDIDAKTGSILDKDTDSIYDD